jgi:hypothetical protein
MGRVAFSTLAAALLCVLALTGCMSTSPTKFHQATQASHFDLIEEAIDKSGRNMIGEHITQELKAGHYKARFENDEYVFYECADNCVLWGLNPLPAKGGLCLPKPGSKADAYLWVYVTRSTQDLGLIGNAADKAEAGNIRVLHYASALPTDFLKSILVAGG